MLKIIWLKSKFTFKTGLIYNFREMIIKCQIEQIGNFILKIEELEGKSYFIRTQYPKKRI